MSVDLAEWLFQQEYVRLRKEFVYLNSLEMGRLAEKYTLDILQGRAEVNSERASRGQQDHVCAVDGCDDPPKYCAAHAGVDARDDDDD